MKRLLFLLLILAACTPVTEKVFVANEESGTISVIDASTLKIIDTITLTTEHDGERLTFAPHNVQAVGNLVLVTANVGGYAHDDHGAVPAVEAHGDESAAGPDHPDQLVVMDAITHKIVQRHDIDFGAHLAHVVSDGANAYVTGTNTEILYSVNLNDGTKKLVELPTGSQPHGLRLSLDNSTAYIASMNNSLLALNLTSKQIKTIPLPGMGVQTAVTDKYSFVSIYSPPQVGRYDLTTGNMTFALLSNARGPIQIYPANGFIYAADQGMLNGDPVGNTLYKINAETLDVVALPAGNAPHGVIAVDNRVFVTNLLGGSVSVFVNDSVVSEIAVGAAPNGITHWHAR